MINVFYSRACRNCQTTNSIRDSYTINDLDFEDCQNKTEFEMAQMIEQWRLDDNYTCNFCNSHNVEATDISTDNYQFYKYDRIARKSYLEDEFMLQINITRISNQTDLDKSWSKNITDEFLLESFSKIINQLNILPNDNFCSQLNANFFICLTSKTNKSSNYKKAIIETLSYSGFTKNEILNYLKKIIDEYEIPLNVITDHNIGSEKEELKEKTFSGGLFKSWFYNIDETEFKGFPFSNVCFEYDSKTVIAYNTLEESPSDFITNNRNNKFKIDQNISPFFLNGKTFYYTKRLSIVDNKFYI